MEIKLNTYKVVEKKYIEDIKSECFVLEHIKTKAKVLVMSNDDENKAFGIGFRTPPTDSTGLPHILEHSVLCGSRKFPVKDPFVELMKSSLNTFLNAFTSPDKTMYPVASCNDKDFANLMDVYLDAVLYPNIYKFEEIFKQEGWHYELHDKDANITINGVVYNEMKGAYSSPDQIMFRESLASLYPDTCYGVSSGGNPDNIPDLSYQDFIAFHKRYYHPSNSYIILYGNMDVNERLEWMDKEYLSNFDYLEIDSEIFTQKPFDEVVEKRIPYPIGQEDSEADKCLMSYNVSIADMTDPVLTMSNTILSYVLLDSPSAILKQELLKAKIGKAIVGGYQDSLKQPMFSVIAKGSNEIDKDKFVETIESTLKILVEKGIDKDMLKATINYYEFLNRESDFGRFPKGLAYGMNAVGTWLYDLSPLDSLELSSTFVKIKKLVETNYFEELIKNYYLNNNHKSIVIIYPDKNVQNEKDHALALKLDAYKKSLTEFEIEKLISDTKDLKVYQMTPSTEEELRTLPVLKRSDIKKEINPLSNIEENIDGIKTIHHDFFTNGIVYLKAIFDITGLEAKYLPYVSLLSSLLTKVNTNKYSYKELDNMINIKSGGISFNTSVTAANGVNNYKLLLSGNTKILYENVNDVIDLMLEIIKGSKFDDVQRIWEIVNEQSAILQNSIVAAGHGTALTRALSYINEYYKLLDEIDGISYYQFIKNLETNFDTEKDNLIKTLSELSSKLLLSDRLIISVTADREGFEVVKNNVHKFNQLSGNCDLKFDYQFAPNILNEGFKTPSNVQYVARCGNFVEKGYKYSGVLNVFKKALSTDYLWLKVRVEGGAYGCMCNFGLNGNVYFVSYRDPNLEKTYRTYYGILDFIKNFNKTDDEMTKYIVGAFGDMDAPLSPSRKGAYSLNCYFSKRTEEDIQQERNEMINCTSADIQGLYDLIKSVLDYNIICVIGNENKVEEAKAMFNEVKYLN